MALNKKIPFIAIVLTAAAFTAAGCSMPAEPEPEASEEVPVAVQVAPAEVGALTQTSEIFGTAQASNEVNVMAKMNGELTALLVKEDQFVNKGDVLGRLDSDQMQIQLELDRLTLEQAAMQYKSLATSGAPQEQLDQAEISLKQAQLKVQLSEMNLDNAVIKAPASGQIIDIAAEPGEIVSAAAPFARIVTLDPIVISASISAEQMIALQEAETIQVEIPDLALSETARIQSISDFADASGFYTLEAQLDNAERKIKPGMLAKFLIEDTVAEDAVLIPTAALMSSEGIHYVYVVKEGRAVRTEVQVLETQSEFTAVEGELQPNDLVVTKGQFTLSDGSAVEIIEEAQ